MNHTCNKCSAQFQITDADLAFYDKVSPVFNGKKYAIPAPTLCPDCRNQRRLTYRNERKLFKRTCDATQEDIISMYNPQCSFPVYKNTYWWSDYWNPLDYGKEFDFSRPFFEQFKELSNAVPRQALAAEQNENSDYVNYAFACKDSYLILGWGENCEDTYYAKNVIFNKNCVDVSYVKYSELCYESSDLEKCYECFYANFNINCSTCWYIYNCIGCKNCFGCVNLQNKQYCLLNEQMTQEEYTNRTRKLKEDFLQQNQDWQEFLEKFATLKRSSVRKYYHGLNTEHCTGDYLRNCKNCEFCFDTSGAEDTKYAVESNELTDCMDISAGGKNGTELCYECVNLTSNRILFSSLIWFCKNLLYCTDCFNDTNNCFGCIGLTKKQYCILNKQYTKEEYETLVPKIIEHMRNTGEWGEFFPVQDSPFAYNETEAFEYYPLSKEETLKCNWVWRDENTEIKNVTKVIQASALPSDITRIPDDILNWAIVCEVSEIPFRITPHELRFYREHSLPVPKLHPDQRHLRRLLSRNPRTLYDRQCAKCSKAIQTTYSPERPETVYCEECYLKEVY